MKSEASLSSLVAGLQSHLNELSQEVERIERDQSLKVGLAVIALLFAGTAYLMGGGTASLTFAVVGAAIGLMMLEPAARRTTLAEQIVQLEERLRLAISASNGRRKSVDMMPLKSK